MQENKIWTHILHCFPQSTVGKDLFSMQETQVQLWGQQEPLEKEMAYLSLCFLVSAITKGHATLKLAPL